MILGRVENALAHVGRSIVLEGAPATRPLFDAPGTLNGHVGVLVALHAISLGDEYLTAAVVRGKLGLIIN